MKRVTVAVVLVAGTLSVVPTSPRTPFLGATTTHAATGEPGLLAVCKAPENGMSGRPFQFALNGGAPFTVAGGRCSGPISAPAGAVTVTELPTQPATDVAGVVTQPADRLVAADVPGRSATVQVVSGAAAQASVTFTNAPAGGPTGTLNLCKLSETPAYWGNLFSFSVNGGPLVSTEASSALADPSTWSCRELGTFATGTRVTVREEVPTGVAIAWFDSVPASSLLDFDRAAGTATVAIAGGANTLLVDDEPVPPPQTGFVEVCSDAAQLDGGGADPDVVGPFVYTVTPSGGDAFDVTLGVGLCSGAYTVPAGVVRVTQHPHENHRLADVSTIPDGRLPAENLVNGTADVEVPVSANPNEETQVHFANRRDRGQLTICAALGPASGALDGTTFTFDVAELDSTVPGPATTKVVSRGGSTQCVVVGDYPVGYRVDVQERSAGPDVSSSGGGTSTIRPGVNVVTVTNTAFGRLGVCMAPVDGLTAQPSFRVRIDGGSLLTIRAGTCTFPVRVAVGTHTVAEVSESAYELDPAAPGAGLAVLPADRAVVTSPISRRITVSVPFGSEGETAVTVYDRVRRGLIVVCEQVAAGSVDALGEKQFPFTVSSTAGAPAAQTLAPGTCSLPVGPYAVLNADATPTRVTVAQLADPPQQFLLDNFTDTDGVDLSTHTPDSGGSWLVRLGEGQIASNAAVDLNNNRVNMLQYSVPAPGPDVTVTASVVIPDGGAGSAAAAGPIARVNPTAQTFYHARFNSGTGQYQLFKFVGGVATNLGNSSGPVPTSGTTRISLVCQGTTIQLWADGVLEISVTDSSIAAAGYVGYRNFSPTSGTARYTVDSVTASTLPRFHPVQAIALTGGRDLQASCSGTAETAVCSNTSVFTLGAGVNIVTYTNRAG